MKYNTLLLRDLENNLVLINPDPETNELDFHIIEETEQLVAKDIPFNQVIAVSVDEPQEDVLNIIKLYTIDVKDEFENPVELGRLSTENEDSFRYYVDMLYKQINEQCSTMIQNQ